MVVSALLVSALVAGMIATVNPCGFAMLPAYLGMFIGDRVGGRRSPLIVGLLVSAGFVAVFLIAGVLVATGVRFVVSWIPWLAAAVGIGLVAVGIAELRGVHIFARLPGVKRAPSSGSPLGLVGFGASYGVASLSCTLPIFLSLVAGAVAGRSFLESLSVFLAYGAGMSLVVVALTIALALGRDRVLRAMRSFAPHLPTISGWILILAGAFIIWYWATVLSAGAVGLAANPLVRLSETISAAVAGVVSSNPLAAVVAVTGLGVVAWLAIRGLRAETTGDAASDDRLDEVRR